MADIQKTLWKFIHTWRDELTKSSGEKIDFIIIYGSAVRGEFVPGKSDVDMVIQVYKKQDKAIVENQATEIFWRISKKYPQLKFEQTLSISTQKKRNSITKILERLEQTSFLYVPVFVFTKGEIDWKHGELKSDSLFVKLGKTLLVPQRSVFLRFKQEGKILFGRDIRKEIAIKLTLLDRLRLGIAPQLLSFVGAIIAPLVPQKAMSYSVKALLYQIDGLLTALDHYEKLKRAQKIAKSEEILLDEYTIKLHNMLHLKLNHTRGLLKAADFGLFYEALIIKQNSKKLSYFQTIKFALQSWWFILRSNLRALVYILFFRKKAS